MKWEMMRKEKFKMTKKKKKYSNFLFIFWWILLYYKVQKCKRNLEYAWSHSWRHRGCEKSKKAHSCIWIWSISNEEWGNHFITSNKIHSHCESSPWSRKNIWRWGAENQDLKLSHKNLGTKDYNNHGIQESSYNDDGSSLRNCYPMNMNWLNNLT